MTLRSEHEDEAAATSRERLGDIVVVSRRHRSKLRNKKKSQESAGRNFDAALELAGQEAETLNECATTMCSRQSDTSVPPFFATLQLILSRLADAR